VGCGQHEETILSSARIGKTLRAARGRRGWSREALAYHSGVSASAIAQIESGRRREVRLSSLAALAGALSVSVDYLIGSDAAMGSSVFEHLVLRYSSDEEFLAATVPFLTQGVERSEAVLAVTTRANIELLRDRLNGRFEDVAFAESIDWCSSPNEAMHRYRTFVTERFEAGAMWTRIVGEPVWAGRSAAEVAAWTRYESLLNLACASLPATILCPYDARAVPAAVVADAHRTHPAVARGTGITANAEYSKPEDFLLEAHTAA
jgi:transcriptional regulator with XRE-family HTH domain